MYYHTTSAFDNPIIPPEQGFTPITGDGNKNNWTGILIIAGLILVTGVVIWIVIDNNNQIKLKNNEPVKTE
jgi:hypothetical protein